MATAKLMPPLTHDHTLTHPTAIPVNDASSAPAGEPLDAASLHKLVAWLSPSYPVGAFSYSSGLEWAIEAGDVTSAATLSAWLEATLRHGGGFCDAVFFARAHDAVTQEDEAGLAGIAELAAAFSPSKERHLETTAQGRAFLSTTCAVWPNPALLRFAVTESAPVAYPVAVGVAAAAHAIPLHPALAAYLHAVLANGVSAGVRLIPLGQTDGQRVLARLADAISMVAEQAIATPLDDVGGAAIRADLASMRHETQYTRLFRS